MVYMKHYEKVQSLKAGNLIPRGKTRAYIHKKRMHSFLNPAEHKEQYAKTKLTNVSGVP